jgi:hypothetical protein
MISQFSTFRELLLHCLKCHDSGQSQQAFTIIDEYLADSRATHPAESFWSEYNVQQALGFRIVLAEKIDQATALTAEERHSGFCRERLEYWLSASADSSARLAMVRFRIGDVEPGRAAASEAIRLAGVLGMISASVAQAAEEARKHTK